MALGIEELKDVVRFGASFGNAIGNSLEDGSVGIGDIVHFIDPLMKVSAAISGIEQVPQELADLDPAEADELVALVVEDFDIPQDDAEVFVEDTLRQVAGLFEYLSKYFL